MRSRRPVAWIGVAILSSLLLAAPAAAQISFGKAGEAAEPLGLSISGGISLGSYQAGVNYGLLEVYRHAAWNPDFHASTNIPVYRLRTVTGASAGNINTLLWAVEACTDLRTPGATYRSPDPDQSLFWQVWLDIGWDRLFNENSRELALFDRAALTDSVARPKLEKRMRDPRLVEGCEVPAGITLTRIKPDTLWLRDLAIETQRHVTAFTLRVDSDSADLGSRVRFAQETHIRPDDQYFGILVRLQPHDGYIPFGNLLEAVKASAAFPVAFAPVELNVWYVKNGTQGTHSFVDGGAFDNNPVGLARNLYALQGDERTLDILYVNPYRLRGELLERRQGRVPPAPSGGLAAVMATLSGAVPTARQYELQLLARERAHRQEVQELQALVPQSLRAQAEEISPGASFTTERLLLSSRAYPVLGEHLSSFGAFLARPGREFDFYVGIYDALYMALWQHTCAFNGDDTAEQRQQRHRCVGEWLPALIQSDNLVRGTTRQVLARLYNREYAPVQIPVAPPAPESHDRVVVQNALFDALGTQFSPKDRTECVDTRLVFQLLCGDGLWDVLETMGEDEAVVDIIDTWSSGCGGERQPACRSERVFWQLLANPMAGATSTMDGVLHRLRQVEVDMRTRPDVTGGNLVAPVTAGQWLFYASHLRSRPEWDRFPNSVPDSHWASGLFISYIGANLGTSGLEARWQPTWNVSNPGFVRGNVIAHFNGQPLQSSDELYAGVGAMAGRYFSKVWISEIGLGANVFRAVSPEGDARTPWEVEASGVFVANQLRLGLRWLPDGDDLGLLHGSRGWALSAGLNDPVGLFYWITRF